MTKKQQRTNINKCVLTLTADRQSATCSRKGAFTLAEVLITLAIIGIVAVVTIPTLVQNQNEKAWSTAQKLFTNKLEVAMRVLNTQEKLIGYDNTTDFVNELKKNIKITKVCAPDKVTECFAKEIYWHDTAEPLSFENGAKITLADDTVTKDVVGVQFANGTTALMAYLKDKCTQDPYNNTFGATSSCLAVVYDVSGYKKPNRYVNTENKSSDIGAINVKKLNGVAGCVLKLADADGKDFCISQILAAGTGYTYMSDTDCADANIGGKLGIKECNYEQDWWAGAVKACGGVDKLLNKEELIAFAKYIYGSEDIDSSGTGNDLSYKDERAEQFLAISDWGNDATNPRFYLWSNIENNANTAGYQAYKVTYTYFYDDERNEYGSLAVCKGDQI